MSKIFQYPFRPLDHIATPKDFAQTVADVPYMGIYQQEATQRYVPGTRYTTWDGRVFKYGKCGLTLEGMKYFVHNHSQLVAEISDPDAELDATVAGATKLYLTVVATEVGSGRNGIIAEDELAGGYISIYSSSTVRPQRLIVGNDALADDGVKLILYIDAPIPTATDASTNTEICANPYIDLRKDDDGGYAAAMGRPCILATTGNFFWIQSWGICRISPDSNINHGHGASRFEFFQKVCGVTQRSDTTVSAEQNMQRVGFRTDRSGGNVFGNTAPFIMLQISI